MSLILTVVVAAGLLSSKLMLELGIHSLQLRYPIALLISFGAFLLLIRIWIWHVCLRPTAAVDLSGLDPGGLQLSGGGGGFVAPGPAAPAPEGGGGVREDDPARTVFSGHTGFFSLRSALQMAYGDKLTGATVDINNGALEVI